MQAVMGELLGCHDPLSSFVMREGKTQASLDTLCGAIPRKVYCRLT